MAQKEAGTFDLGSSTGSVEITGGPNDWDMWLCLRGTTHEVCFHTGDRPIRFVQFAGGGATFFSAKISSMEAEPFSRARGDIWTIKGRVVKGNYSYYFSMVYDSQYRKGKVEFFKV